MPDSTQRIRSFSILEIAQKHSIEWEGARRTKGVPFLKKHASPAFLAKDINEMTHQVFQEELDRYCLGRPVHQNGNRLKAEFNSLMHFAVCHGYRTTPYKTLGSVQRVSQADMVLSAEEVDIFILAVDRKFRDDLTVRIAVRAMVLLGLSLSEASNFDLKQIDFKRWRYVQAGKGSLRDIPIPSHMRPLLNHLADQSNLLRAASTPWFRKADLQNLVRSFGVPCGLPGLMPAMLTRTAIRGVRKV